VHPRDSKGLRPLNSRHCSQVAGRNGRLGGGLPKVSLRIYGIFWWRRRRTRSPRPEVRVEAAYERFVHRRKSLFKNEVRVDIERRSREMSNDLNGEEISVCSSVRNIVFIFLDTDPVRQVRFEKRSCQLARCARRPALHPGLSIE
jgi:hypothetical protein